MKKKRHRYDVDAPRPISPRAIRAIRRDLGFTQHQLQYIMRIGADSLCRWENGSCPPSPALQLLLELIRDVPEARAYAMKGRQLPPGRRPPGDPPR